MLPGLTMVSPLEGSALVSLGIPPGAPSLTDGEGLGLSFLISPGELLWTL